MTAVDPKVHGGPKVCECCGVPALIGPVKRSATDVVAQKSPTSKRCPYDDLTCTLPACLADDICIERFEEEGL